MIKKIELFIFALFLFLTSATAVDIYSFRLSDMSIAMLVVIGLHLCLDKDRDEHYMPIAYVLGLLASIGVSTLFNLFDFNQSAILIDFANAVIIPLAICGAYFFGRFISRSDQLNLLKFYIKLTITICIILYLYEKKYGHPDWIKIIDETDRYSAFSQNPNQLALYLLPIPFMVLFIQAVEGGSKIKSYVEIMLVIILNLMTFGKGLFVAWLVGFALIGLFGVTGVLNKRKIIFKISILLVFLPLLYLVLQPIWVALYIGDAPGSMDGQGEGRIMLWLNGLSAWLKAPFFGHGPGHYSGHTTPFEGIEAHNFFIDWLAAYGIVGGIALLTFYLMLIKKAYTDNSWVILALYASILTQTLFHFYGRQPVYWLWWIVGYYLSTIKSTIESKKTNVWISGSDWISRNK